MWYWVMRDKRHIIKTSRTSDYFCFNRTPLTANHQLQSTFSSFSSINTERNWFASLRKKNKYFTSFKVKCLIFVYREPLTLALSSPVTLMLFILYTLHENGLPSTGWFSINTSIICLPKIQQTIYYYYFHYCCQSNQIKCFKYNSPISFGV